MTAAKGAQVETTAGTVQLRGIAGPLRVPAAPGSILAELLAWSGLEDSILNGGRGDVTISIPSNLAVTPQVHGNR